MQEKFKFIIILIVASACSMLIKKREIKISARVHPGEVIKINLGQRSEGFSSVVNCLDKEFLINREKDINYLLWSESYFSIRKRV